MRGLLPYDACCESWQDERQGAGLRRQWQAGVAGQVPPASRKYLDTYTYNQHPTHSLVLDPVTDYEKIARIGEGTFGVVYKARERSTGQVR